MRRFLAGTLLLGLALTVTACTPRVRPVGSLAGGYGEFNAVDRSDVKLRLEGAEPVSKQELKQFRKARKLQIKEADERRRERVARLVSTGKASETTAADTPLSCPLVFVIAEPEWHASATLAPASEQEKVLFTIRERFYRYMLRNYAHPVRVRYAWRTNDPLTRGARVLTLRTRVTQVDKGVGWLRYTLGFGAGITKLQLEGEIIEGTTEPRVVGEFVIRGMHGAYAQMGLNPSVLKPGYCLRYAAEEMIASFCDELPLYLPDPTTSSQGPGQTAAIPESRPQGF